MARKNTINEGINKMDDANKNPTFLLDRVKLSSLYEKVGNYLEKNGDANIIGIAYYLSGTDDSTVYSIELSDLQSYNTKMIDEIKIECEEIPYTYEDRRKGIIPKGRTI